MHSAATVTYFGYNQYVYLSPWRTTVLPEVPGSILGSDKDCFIIRCFVVVAVVVAVVVVVVAVLFVCTKHYFVIVCATPFSILFHLVYLIRNKYVTTHFYQPS